MSGRQKIRLLRGSNGGVDFARPVYLSDDEFKALKRFLGGLYDFVEVETEFEEPRTERLGAKSFSRSWSAKEVRLLLGDQSNQEICERLGRTPMSVVSQRGKYLSLYIRFGRRRGTDLRKLRSPTMVSRFFADLDWDENETLRQVRIRREREQSRLLDHLGSLEIQKISGDPAVRRKIAEIKARLENTQRALVDLGAVPSA